MKRISLIAISVLAFGITRAQEKQDILAASSQLTTILGLDEKQAAMITPIVNKAEKDVAEFRVEAAAIQRKVDATYLPYYTEMEPLLQPEQLEKLNELRKSGGLGATGCGTKDPGKVTGCCAGGKAKAAAPSLTNSEATPSVH